LLSYTSPPLCSWAENILGGQERRNGPSCESNRRCSVFRACSLVTVLTELSRFLYVLVYKSKSFHWNVYVYVYVYVYVWSDINMNIDICLCLCLCLCVIRH
jgi:hypothetical protein